MTTKAKSTAKKSTSTVGRQPQKRNDLAEMHAKHSTPKGRGRPAGSRNKKTLVAMAVRDGLEQQLLERGQEILQVVMDQAVEGCRTSQKMVLDRLMPAVKAEDANAGKQTPSINITIGKAEDTPEVKRIQGMVINAD